MTTRPAHSRSPAAPSVTPRPARPPVTAPATLPLGDDALVLSHRLAEWAGHAPVLEEELALANIALDLLGQARALYAELTEVLGSEDEIAYLREERSFLNCQLVEQPGGDFAHTIVRQLFFSAYQLPLHAQLASTLPLAAKTVHEIAYHRDHAEQWTLRLGDGTDESHARTQRAVDALWRFTGELFQPIEGLDAVRWPQLAQEWDAVIGDVFGRAGLTVPDTPRHGAWSAGAGRQGVHTEPFGRMLAEMQHLHRSHPGAQW